MEAISNEPSLDVPTHIILDDPMIQPVEERIMEAISNEPSLDVPTDEPMIQISEAEQSSLSISAVSVVDNRIDIHLDSQPINDGPADNPHASSTDGVETMSFQSAQLLTTSPGLSLIAQFESTEDSDTDSSSDSSDDSIAVASDTEPIERQQSTVVDTCPKVKGEIDYRELPPNDECKIVFPSDGKLLPIGEVSHYTEKLIVIQSFPNTPAVNEGTVLWKGDKTSIARIFETFGPVKTPFYSILVQSKEHANRLGLTTGDTVYVVPGDLSLTMYVFTSKLLEQKGCDASWKNDVEMPDEYQQFSDDEQEISKRKNKKQGQKQTSEKKGPSPQPSSGTYQRSNPSSGIYQRSNPSSGTYQRSNPSSGIYQQSNPSSGTYQRSIPSTSDTYQRSNPSSGTYQRSNPFNVPRMVSPQVGTYPLPAYSETQYRPPSQPLMYSPNHAISSPPYRPPFFGHTYPYPPLPPPPPGYHPWNRFPPPQ
ncbi:H/ACA ribonucleoprotein complex non-core subunit NAF1-like [Halichondria panicea]|uniref:H/ACA ribonucleoprotein complex non-core subunit NAF1-like n=1 Tax=Halichondria panicea TaxID=6063 RepID=UPI00312B2E73